MIVCYHWPGLLAEGYQKDEGEPLSLRQAHKRSDGVVRRGCSAHSLDLCLIYLIDNSLPSSMFRLLVLYLHNCLQTSFDRDKSILVLPRNPLVDHHLQLSSVALYASLKSIAATPDPREIAYPSLMLLLTSQEARRLNHPPRQTPVLQPPYTPCPHLVLELEPELYWPLPSLWLLCPSVWRPHRPCPPYLWPTAHRHP